MSNKQEVDLTKALAITGKDGQLRLFKSQVALSVSDGTLVDMAGVGIMVGNGGYRRVAARAGLVTMQASTVIVDGVEQRQPRVERDANKQAQVVISRAFCVGYTSMGLPMIVDRTVIFDLLAYRSVDLLSKAEWNPDSFRLVDANRKPPQGWSLYPIDDVMGVMVKRADPEVLKWAKTQQNRKRKAVEICQTFAVRNATKAHPAVTIPPTFPTRDAVVDVLGWRPVEGHAFAWDMNQFTCHLKQIEEMVGDGSRDAEGVAVDSGADSLHDDPEAGSIDVDDVASDDGHGSPGGQPGVDQEKQLQGMRDVLKVVMVDGVKAEQQKVALALEHADAGPYEEAKPEWIDSLTPNALGQVHAEVMGTVNLDN